MPLQNPLPRHIAAFDEQIKRYHAQFSLPYDWRLLKAQLVAESGLNPAATSPVGAKGLAQFMPGTWAEMLKALKLPADTSPYNTDASIQCCAYYMSVLLNKWTAKREDIDRYCLALASYNGGTGNLLKAQKASKGGKALGYGEIIPALPLITEKVMPSKPLITCRKF